jgi:pilus assembly protein CpaB
MPFRLIIAAVLLIAAIGLGRIAYQALNPTVAVATEASVAQVRLLVAAQPLQAGTLLKDTDLRERDVALADVPEGAMVLSEDARAEIRGAMLRRYLDAGGAVLRSDVLRPRDRGFLAAVLTPGTRAVSIGVDAKTGAAGLISPGDMVDVILTQEFQRGDTSVGRRIVAETVLAGIRVIAVDQQIAQGAPASTPVPSPGGNRVASTVTLQVTPEQSERVAVAERLGRLVLTVRSIDAVDAAEPTRVRSEDPPMAGAPPRPNATAVIFGSDVSAALSRDEPAAAPRMRVIQGTNATDVVFR